MEQIFKFRDGRKADFASDSITEGDAKIMHTKYLQNPLKVKINGNIKTLKGFSFDKSDILDILNRTDQNVKELFIFFGADPEGFVKIIAGGISNDNNSILSDKLYDMCDPCPDKCPINIDSFNTNTPA